MKERRKTKRHTLIYYMRAFDVRTRNLLGYLVDITPQGIMLLCDDPIPTDKPFRLKLELTEDISDKPFLELGVQSIWCHPDIDPHFYNTGFKIVEIGADDTDTVNRIIETYGLQEQRKAIAKQSSDSSNQAKK